jgi:hypothetical protein
MRNLSIGRRDRGSRELVVIDDAGHAGGSNMTAALMSATDPFRQPGPR